MALSQFEKPHLNSSGVHQNTTTTPHQNHQNYNIYNEIPKSSVSNNIPLKNGLDNLQMSNSNQQQHYQQQIQQQPQSIKKRNKDYKDILIQRESYNKVTKNDGGVKKPGSNNIFFLKI